MCFSVFITFKYPAAAEWRNYKFYSVLTFRDFEYFLHRIHTELLSCQELSSSSETQIQQKLSSLLEAKRGREKAPGGLKRGETWATKTAPPQSFQKGGFSTQCPDVDNGNKGNTVCRNSCSTVTKAKRLNLGEMDENMEHTPLWRNGGCPKVCYYPLYLGFTFQSCICVAAASGTVRTQRCKSNLASRTFYSTEKINICV